MILALERWKNLLERQADTETSPTGSRTGGDLIPDLVQILFDLLPALRAAKQTYCIRLAENSAHPETMALGQADVSRVPFSVKASRDGVDRKLKAVGGILSEWDKSAAVKGKDAALNGWVPHFGRGVFR